MLPSPVVCGARLRTVVVSYVQALLEHNAKVYLAARNPEKAHATIEALKVQTGKEAIFLELDLSSLEAVRKAAAEFLRCVVPAVM